MAVVQTCEVGASQKPLDAECEMAVDFKDIKPLLWFIYLGK
jgi:hypothetical protein